VDTEVFFLAKNTFGSSSSFFSSSDVVASPARRKDVRIVWNDVVSSAVLEGRTVILNVPSSFREFTKVAMESGSNRVI